MTLKLDHIVIAVRDLDTAIADFKALGFTVNRGGVHANGATHNALIVFSDGTYPELLAPTDQPPLPDLIDFGALLREDEGLSGFALRSDDLDADAARLRAAGFGVGDPSSGERRREDGVLVRWRLALLDGGFAPFLIEDVTPHNLRVPADSDLTAHLNGARGVCGLAIVAHDLPATQDRYARLFGVPSGEALPGITLRDGNADALAALQLEIAYNAKPPTASAFSHGVRFEPCPAEHNAR